MTFDEAFGDVQTAIDAACAGLVINGIVYTAGDITVAGGPMDSAPITLTFDGTSVAGDDHALVVASDIDLNDNTPPVESETTKGAPIGATSSITVTPVLTALLSGAEAITFGPQALEVTLGEGNFTYDETREVEFLRNRGVIDTYKQGDEQPMDVSLDFTWEDLTALSGAAVPTVEDVLKQRGAAADWVSSNTGDPCADYVVDIVIINAPDCGNILDEVITLPQFFWTQLSHDTDAATVSVTGQCNAKQATVVRTDAHI